MSYSEAKKKYAKIGIDTEKVLKDLSKIAISLHCCQGDDVGGFETTGGASGGIRRLATIRARPVRPRSCSRTLSSRSRSSRASTA